ncbi:MAG: Asparagine synthetase [glutamine-hydrolyzing] 1 [Chroococcopsis gigantea SAG 12.99]|jgi:asparagine synthase (glutamine-hydrolysing)|nr:Asparagine synthetase [glutamine-hydrolyzing] 1 [Chroococcopsis gigantea SAG 12.99]
MKTNYQFIGYWGITSLAELETFTSITTASKTRSIVQQQETWGIIYSGISEIPAHQGIIAALSAAGIDNQLDCWVKIQNNCLILGREPFGRVPLYWTRLKQTIWFASQFQLLLPLIENPEINLSALSAYTNFSYIPTPLTPVKQIFTISPGKEQVWRLNPTIEKLPEKSLYQFRSLPKLIQEEKVSIRQLQTLLEDSISEQIADLTNEPVGVFLSGGLDSSIIAALLVRAGVKVRAYSLDCGIGESSELSYAEQVANFLKIPLVKVAATPKQIKKALLATVKALDLPFGDGVTVPLYLLGEVASQETGIVFNGEHGDQLFAGWTNKPLIAASVYKGEDSFSDQYMRTFHRFHGYEASIFQPRVYREINSYNPGAWLKEALDETFTDCFLDRLRRGSLMLKGSQNIQPRATNLAFTHGLSIRSPFCYLPLAEWTFQMPGELFLRGATEKYILKAAVEPWLPPDIVGREKRGMGVPLTRWCLSSLWSTLGYWLHPDKLQLEAVFTPYLAMQIILGSLGGQIKGRRIGELLWLLLIWEVWRCEVLGETASVTSLYNPFWMPYQGWKMLSNFQSKD